MRVLVLGSDGYIGWPLILYLKGKGHEVYGVDNLMRREHVKEVGSKSAIPIATTWERQQAFRDYFGDYYWYSYADIRKPGDAELVLETVRPDTIVHLAEQPSAPFSMKSEKHCIYTMENNVLGTLYLLYAMKKFCPEAHLVKLGSMGEYGTPGVTITEGFVEVNDKRLPFPREPGSFYHASKVHDSVNIHLACKLWGLRSTDIMQGVVYGTSIDGFDAESRLCTRFDYDQYFGTVINRFVAQAVVGHPLTVYGGGEQKRSFLPLGDSVACINLLIENPPNLGEYRVVNQFDEIILIKELAHKVQTVGNTLNLPVVSTKFIGNPRVEEEGHHYEVERHILKKLGYVPCYDMEEMIEGMLLDLLPFKDRIIKEVIMPMTNWRL
jgi:UDP-sulfoquinovose synthase